jgi:signal transduction histidine kinase
MLMVVAVPGITAAASDGDARTILILSSEDSLHPFGHVTTDTIVAKLNDSFSADLTIRAEFMESSQTPDGPDEDVIASRLAAKYSNEKIDLVFATGPQALSLLVHKKATLFPGTPVIFTGIRNGNPMLKEMAENWGAVTTDYNVASTVKLAQALQPDLKRLVLVTGGSAFDRLWHGRAHEDLAASDIRLEVVDLAALPLDDVLRELGKLGPDSAVLYLTIWIDGDGHKYQPHVLVERIAKASAAPVYSVYPTSIGRGVVGGYMTKFETQGAYAAEMAVDFLKDNRVEAIRVISLPSVYHVDWRALERWNLDPERLPAGTIIANSDPSFIERYWDVVLAGLAVIALQAGLIVALLIHRRKLRQTHEQLRQINRHVEIAASSAKLGLWSWNPATGLVWMTPYCRTMLDLSPDDRLDLDTFLHRLAGKTGQDTKNAMVSAVLQDTLFQAQFRRSDGSGRKHWLSAVGHTTKDGPITHLIGTLMDVSDRRRAEIDADEQRRQLIHLTRVTVLGEFSGSLAHELNQPLTAMLANTQAAQVMLDDEEPDIEEIKEILEDIVDDNKRAGDVISRLRSLVKKEDVAFRDVDLNDVVDGVVELIHSDLIERHIELRTALDPNMPMVRGDSVQIQQVLLNLVRNACDAMSASENRQLTLTTDAALENGAGILVADTGKGVPPELQDKVFEPFITSKNHGLGLGLAISRTILKAHGGSIWCKQNPGGGAIFAFALPAAERRMAWAS